MKQLSKAIIREVLIYTPSNGKLFWKKRDRKWFDSDFQHRMFNGQFAGKEAFTCIDNSGYHVGAVFNKRYLAHRVIWLWMTGRWPNSEVDHINHIKGDNRWSNLRETTRQVGAKNMSLSRRNNSGRTGIAWRNDKHCWRARIGIDGRDILLGHFHSFEAAAAARKAAERKYGFHPNHGK